MKEPRACNGRLNSVFNLLIWPQVRVATRARTARRDFVAPGGTARPFASANSCSASGASCQMADSSTRLTNFARVTSDSSAGNKPPILRTRQQSTARKSSSYFQPGKKISFTMQYFTFLNESISVQIILAAIETGDERPF